MPETFRTDAPNRQWIRWTLLFWALGAAVMLWYKWHAIRWFSLGDTDDNMRYAQVAAWLHGQGWFDLRQYKLDPPHGASIHWSRLVDLPLAGLILLVRPFTDAFTTARTAVAIAPLLPLGIALFGVALTARRLVAPGAFALAAALLFCANSTLLMFMPLRIDHHGWQLALLTWTIAGGADPDRRRGGLTAGLAAALSLTIGLEMLPYLALASGMVALRWVWDRAEAPRMAAQGIALGAGSALGFALFASYDNRAPVCDALSPVWLSAVLLGGALFLMLSGMKTERRDLRLAAAVAAAIVVAGGFALVWPQCLGTPEHLSPELRKLWFSHINEVRPIYAHGWRTWFPVGAPVLSGLIGYGLALRRNWRTDRFIPWLTTAVLALTAAGLMLWQTRAGPAAQLFAVPGMTMLGWALLPWCINHRWMAMRVAGTVAAFLLVSGVASGLLVRAIPEKKDKPAATANAPKPVAGAKPKPSNRTLIDLANRRCPTLPALHAVARVPAATILTFIDLGPRLIATTHHRAIAGPYHRNQAALLDVIHAFRGTPAVAHDVMVRHGATLLLTCPGMSESTIYMAEAKGGFYWQLARGKVPAWLQPIPLPADSPFKLWRRLY